MSKSQKETNPQRQHDPFLTALSNTSERALRYNSYLTQPSYAYSTKLVSPAVVKKESWSGLLTLPETFNGTGEPKVQQDNCHLLRK